MFTERGSIYGIGLLADWFCALSDHRGSHYGIDDDLVCWRRIGGISLVPVSRIIRDTASWICDCVICVLLIFTRPFALKCLSGRVTRTNADSLIGSEVRVTEEVNNQKGTGDCAGRWSGVDSQKPG